ncbi:class I adenylate-forming enzyme family protein [Thermopolyspora sp. NPDC052614]|uniref:class I adenylate-forming enzyme family protein n=1 Tax=Thermopolyspora sp. NPDC052614 TaxID=3155682 RepID=UPI00343359B4
MTPPLPPFEPEHDPGHDPEHDPGHDREHDPGHDIVSEVLSAARRTPDAVAIIDGRGRTLTYGELARRVLAVRSALGPLDAGETVLFAVRPGPDAVVTAVGTVAAGGMIMLVDPGLAPAVLAGRLAAARPRWVIAESPLYLLSGPLRALARRRGLLLPRLADPLPGRTLRHLHTGPWLPGVPRGALSLRRLPDGDPAEPHAEPGRPAVVVFTSGTTGRPKGVVHSSESLARGAAMLREIFPLGPGDVVHTDQLMLGLPALMAGATWSLPGDPGRYLAELAERNATHAFCVPVRLAALLDGPARLPGGLRHLLLGTAPAPPAVLRRAIAAGPHVNVLSVYAMTEALPIAVATAEEKLAHLDGDLLGPPLPGVGVRVADDGELFVSGPHLARGYLGEPPLREVATGDLARIDAEGRLVLLGRKKDMLLRDGFNIYPGLYEPAIAALPGVAEAAIVGLADPETGDEEVVLAVVPASSGFDEIRLRKALPEIVDAGALPDRVVVLGSLPRAGRTEKLDRAALRAILSGTTAT